MRCISTAYGPPWVGIQGTGVTATGIDLRNNPHIYIVAVDPRVIPLHSKLAIEPNPFGGAPVFHAEDTGGAIKGAHVDFYDWRGRKYQLEWGTRWVTVTVFGHGSLPHKPTPATGGPRAFPHVPANQAPPPGGASTAFDYSAVLRSASTNLKRVGGYLSDAGEAIRKVPR